MYATDVNQTRTNQAFEKALDTYVACRKAGLRVTRFRLTARQLDDLRAATGQTSTLLGIPVEQKAGDG